MSIDLMLLAGGDNGDSTIDQIEGRHDHDQDEAS
jgi:hypothetical protein